MTDLITSILISLGIGVVAGIIDITPMVAMKLDRYAIAAAFVHWVVLGLVIVHVVLPGVPGWLKGLVLGVLLGLSTILMVTKEDRKSIPPIVIMSLILGTLVGLAGTLTGLSS